MYHHKIKQEAHWCPSVGELCHSRGIIFGQTETEKAAVARHCRGKDTASDLVTVAHYQHFVINFLAESFST